MDFKWIFQNMTHRALTAYEGYGMLINDLEQDRFQFKKRVVEIALRTDSYSSPYTA